MREHTSGEALFQDRLAEHLLWNKARLTLLTRFILSLIRVRSVNLTQIALCLNAQAKPGSNYRRLQRFLAEFTIDRFALARLLLALLPPQAHQKALLLIIDRTNWKLGRTEINVLVLAVAYRGVAVPLFWQVLNREGVGKAGNSHSRERIALMTDALRLIKPEQIRGVLADREFIGKVWFEWLIRQRIFFYIRIRKNTLVQYPDWMKRRHLGIGPIPKVPIGRLLSGLQPGEIRFVGGRRRRKASYRVFGQPLHLIGLKCASDDVLIATNAEPEEALSLYRQRWEIECMFKAMKSSGFDFEQTHLTHPDRLSKLVAVMSIALLWAHRVGDGLELIKPSKVKTHGRRAQSVFRRGLDHLRESLLNLHLPAKTRQLRWCLQILSCT